MEKQHKKNKSRKNHRREGVAGVRNQQTGFTHSSVTHRDALDKPRRTHFPCSLNLFSKDPQI